MDRVEDEFAFLKDDTLDADLKKVLIEKVFEERNQKREAALKAAEWQATQVLEKKKFWHNTPLVVALVGTITIAANALSSIFLKDADASYEASKDERAFAFGVIEKELSKSNDTAARAGVLLFLVRAGILNSLNRAELEQMALNDLANAKVDPNTVGIPETVGLPNYNLSVPTASPDQTPAAQKLLEVATGEINKNIEETVSPDAVMKFWTALPDFPNPSADVPWSGAFMSWIIKESGNPDDLPLSASNADLWRRAQAKGITFARPEKDILPGDIVFTARSAEDAEAIRTSGEFKPSTPGVIFTVADNELEYIAGNMGNAIRLRKISALDPKIVGFARLGSGSASAEATGE